MKFKKGQKVITKYGIGWVVDIDGKGSDNPRPIVKIDKENTMPEGLLNMFPDRELAFFERELSYE